MNINEFCQDAAGSSGRDMPRVFRSGNSFSGYLTAAERLTPLWQQHRTDQDNCITTFINPASTQTIITITAMPVAVYLSQR